MRVLFVTSELTPLIKTGGLADVSAALPEALLELGLDIRVLLPGYSQVLRALPNLKLSIDFNKLELSGFLFLPSSRLLRGKLPNGVPVYVFDCPELYQREGGAYQNEAGEDWPDNAKRFGFFSKVAAFLSSSATTISWKPQIVHCNDWQAGLVPAYLSYMKSPARTVMSVHNLAYQGNFQSAVLPELGLPWDCYQPEGVEFYGQLSFMKAGLHYADQITTVSPSYANEIQTESLGFGMQGLLRHRRSNLSGILNGIDYRVWNPATDTHLVQSYDLKHLTKKSANKLELQRRVSLEQNASIPLFGLVSRFAHQKGLDIVLEAAQKLIELPAQIVFLGSGDSKIEEDVLKLARQNPGKIAAHVGFDEGLSHLIEAGADMFLMPSRFEPCGLNQMYSQHYGTPPIVHATGGLIDTVVDCNTQSLKDNTATGFVFNTMSADSLLNAANRAISIYQDKKSWLKLQKNCMQKDLSWRASALLYKDMYSNLLK